MLLNRSSFFHLRNSEIRITGPEGLASVWGWPSKSHQYIRILGRIHPPATCGSGRVVCISAQRTSPAQNCESVQGNSISLRSRLECHVTERNGDQHHQQYRGPGCQPGHTQGRRAPELTALKDVRLWQKSRSRPSTFFLLPRRLFTGGSPSTREPLSRCLVGVRDRPAWSSSIWVLKASDTGVETVGKINLEVRDEKFEVELVASLEAFDKSTTFSCPLSETTCDPLSWATISMRFLRLAALSASISIFLLLLLRCRGTERFRASSYWKTPTKQWAQTVLATRGGFQKESSRSLQSGARVAAARSRGNGGHVSQQAQCSPRSRPAHGTALGTANAKHSHLPWTTEATAWGPRSHWCSPGPPWRARQSSSSAGDCPRWAACNQGWGPGNRTSGAYLLAICLSTLLHRCCLIGLSLLDPGGRRKVTQPCNKDLVKITR